MKSSEKAPVDPVRCRGPPSLPPTRTREAAATGRVGVASPNVYQVSLGPAVLLLLLATEDC